MKNTKKYLSKLIQDNFRDSMIVNLTEIRFLQHIQKTHKLRLISKFIMLLNGNFPSPPPPKMLECLELFKKRQKPL